MSGAGPVEGDLSAPLANALDEVRRVFSVDAGAIWSDDFRPDKLPLVFHLGTNDGVRVFANDVGELALGETGVFDRSDPSVNLERRVIEEWIRHYQISGEKKSVDGVRLGILMGERVCLTIDLQRAGIDWHDVNEATRFIVHECFHHYQLFVAQWRTPRGYDPFAEGRHYRVDRQLADLEVELLECAVDADDDQMVRLAQRFVSIRNQRHARRALAKAQEDGYELVEGTARYVENRYAQRCGRVARLGLPSELERRSDDWYEAGRFYRTGARLGELLDRFGVNWRCGVADGTPLFRLLADTLSATAPMALR